MAVGLIAFGACDNSTTSPELTTPPDNTALADSAAAPSQTPDTTVITLDGPSMATSYTGGMPFGAFELPNSQYGDRYNNAMRIIGPSLLLSDLSTIRSRGGKIIVNLAGGRSRYTDASGNFSLSMWKTSVNRFKNINFSSYIQDGTIIAHYLMDEPNNKSKWNGKTVSQATLDQMAQYSKQLWPGMATVVRAYPDYLAAWSGTYHYLDAAWAQYVYRKGPVSDFLSENVSLANKQGLALVVGLNVLRGGPNDSKMTASQIESWGSTLLGSSYPCAFVSWEYNSTYFSTSSIRDAMTYLSNKAGNKSLKSCKS